MGQAAQASLGLIPVHALVVDRRMVAGELEEVRRAASDDAVGVSAKLGVLGADGFPDVPFVTASVERYPDRPDWVVLRCDGSVSRDVSADEARATRRLWADVLREWAGRVVVGFAFLSDEADFAGPRTVLEISLGLDPEETIGLLETQVRGYSWITVISSGVAEILGGVDAIFESGAFHQVAGLPSGAAWLEATPDLSEYDADRQLRVAAARAEAASASLLTGRATANAAPKALDASSRVAPWTGRTAQSADPRGEVMYRVYGGGAGKAGSWLTPINPMSSAAARQGLALPAENSALEGHVRWRRPHAGWHSGSRLRTARRLGSSPAP